MWGVPHGVVRGRESATNSHARTGARVVDSRYLPVGLGLGCGADSDGSPFVSSADDPRCSLSSPVGSGPHIAVGCLADAASDACGLTTLGCRGVPSRGRIMWQTHGELWTAYAHTWPWRRQASHRRLGLAVPRRNRRTHNAARPRTARLPGTSWPMTTASIAAGASTGARQSGGGRTGLRGSARAAETQRQATRHASAAERRTIFAIGTVGCAAGTANRSRVCTPCIGAVPLRGVGISRDSGKRGHGLAPAPFSRASHW